MRDGDGDGVVCESGSRSVSPASSLSSPRASGTGCGPRTATARRCGAIIPTASRVSAVARKSVILDGTSTTTCRGCMSEHRRQEPVWTSVRGAGVKAVRPAERGRGAKRRALTSVSTRARCWLDDAAGDHDILRSTRVQFLSVPRARQHAWPLCVSAADGPRQRRLGLRTVGDAQRPTRPRGKPQWGEEWGRQVSCRTPKSQRRQRRVPGRHRESMLNAGVQTPTPPGQWAQRQSGVGCSTVGPWSARVPRCRQSRAGRV